MTVAGGVAVYIQNQQTKWFDFIRDQFYFCLFVFWWSINWVSIAKYLEFLKTCSWSLPILNKTWHLKDHLSNKSGTHIFLLFQTLRKYAGVRRYILFSKCCEILCLKQTSTLKNMNAFCICQAVNYRTLVET